MSKEHVQLSLFPELVSHFEVSENFARENQEEFRLSYVKREGMADYLRSKVFKDNYRFTNSEDDLKKEEVWRYTIGFYKEGDDRRSVKLDSEVVISGAPLSQTENGEFEFRRKELALLFAMHANDNGAEDTFDNLVLRKAYNMFSEEGDGALIMVSIEDENGRIIKNISSKSAELFNKKESALAFVEAQAGQTFQNTMEPYLQKSVGFMAGIGLATGIDSVANSMGEEGVVWPFLYKMWSYVETGAKFINDNIDGVISTVKSFNETALDGHLALLNPVVDGVGNIVRESINFVDFSAPLENAISVGMSALLIAGTYHGLKMAYGYYKEFHSIEESIEEKDYTKTCTPIYR